MSTQLLNVKDVARLLNVSVRQVWRRLSAGQLPQPVRIGKSVRWSDEIIETWIGMGCPDRQAFDVRLRGKKGGDRHEG